MAQHESSTQKEPGAEIPFFPMARDPRCPFSPPPELKRLQAETPVSKVRIWDGRTAWLVTRYEDVRFVLRDARFSVNPHHAGWPPMSAGQAATRRDLKPNIFALDNPEHNVLRRMQSADFRIVQIEAWRPRVQELVDGAIDAMLKMPKPVDLWEAFALKVPSIVICEMLGVPYEDHEFFQHHSEQLVATHSSKETVDESLEAIRKFLKKLVEKKAQEPTSDILSRMATEQVRTGLLNSSEVADLCMMLLIAGHDTTSNTICLATALLIQHPDQLEIFRKGDQAVVAKAVEEILRFLDVPHLGRRRVALEDVEVGGQLIKAGDGVIAAQMVADRDGTAFESPDNFDITRDARHHLGFGFGTHQCLGQPLVRVEVQTALRTLFQRIPTLKLAIPMEEVAFDYEALVYGVHELPVTW
jgi:cytochrome P450